MKKCKHKFKHVIIVGKCMRRDDRKIYEWLVHQCIYCKKISIGNKLEKENIKYAQL